MGPRSDERGNPEWKLVGVVGDTLQWGRARMSAEMREASLTRERDLAVLQWGRARMSAEMVVLFAVPIGGQ